MNRRDATKAAVAGVAGAMLPVVASMSLPPIGTPYVPVLTKVLGHPVAKTSLDEPDLWCVDLEWSNGTTAQVVSEKTIHEWAALIGGPLEIRFGA